jgi:hypothetical protein
MKKVMKKIILNSWVLLLFAFTPAHAYKKCFNESGTDDNGCVWNIAGCVNWSIGWNGLHIDSYDFTVKDCHGGKWHFQGKAATPVSEDGPTGWENKITPNEFLHPIEATGGTIPPNNRLMLSEIVNREIR